MKSTIDNNIKAFNTAIISSKIISNKTETQKNKSSTERLTSLIQTNAFHAIIKLIQTYAEENHKTIDEASIEIIQTFREIDEIWNEYIFNEGLNKLKEILKKN
jgi:hypothetical protein